MVTLPRNNFTHDPNFAVFRPHYFAGACAALTSSREVYQWSVVYSVGTEPYARPRLLDWGVYTAQSGCPWCPKQAVQPKLRLAALRVVGFTGFAWTGDAKWPPYPSVRALIQKRMPMPTSPSMSPTTTFPSTSPISAENTTVDEEPAGGIDPMIYVAFCVVIVAQVRRLLATPQRFRDLSVVHLTVWRRLLFLHTCVWTINESEPG